MCASSYLYLYLLYPQYTYTINILAPHIIQHVDTYTQSSSQDTYTQSSSQDTYTQSSSQDTYTQSSSHTTCRYLYSVLLSRTASSYHMI